MYFFAKCTVFSLIFSILIQDSDSIKLDGSVQPCEWKDAKEYDLGNGNKVLLSFKKNLLYVALSSPDKIWAHVYVSDGKRVKVMHISAALDAIHYWFNGLSWQTSETFQYELRGSPYNSTQEQKMSEYFENDHWVANNVSIGDGKTIEVKINIQDDLYLACVMSNYDMKITSFPASLTDATILPKLIQGYAIDSLTFVPETWFKIK
jgi:hypothetical protein